MSFPSTASELLRLIEETFPEVTPKPGDSHDDIMFKAGQRSVYHILKRRRDEAAKPPAPPRQRGVGRSVR